MTQPPPPADLEALSGLLEKATRGPWWTEGDDGIYARVKGGRPNGEGIARANYYSRDIPEAVANADLIAAAVTALPQLISELRQSRADLADRERRIEGLTRDARRFQYLVNKHSYHYGMSMAEPSPAEWGIEWHFQQSKPGEQLLSIVDLIDADIDSLDEIARAALEDERP